MTSLKVVFVHSYSSIATRKGSHSSVEPSNNQNIKSRELWTTIWTTLFIAALQLEASITSLAAGRLYGPHAYEEYDWPCRPPSMHWSTAYKACHKDHGIPSWQGSHDLLTWQAIGPRHARLSNNDSCTSDKHVSASAKLDKQSSPVLANTTPEPPWWPAPATKSTGQMSHHQAPPCGLQFPWRPMIWQSHCVSMSRLRTLGTSLKDITTYQSLKHGHIAPPLRKRSAR